MTATHGVGTYGNAVGTVTPLDHKMAQLGLVVKTAANTIRAGLFWDGNATVVSGKANMSYDVRALTAVLSRGATAGAVLLSNDAVFNVVTTAAPGSNSRYDVVYLWQREFSIDGTDSNPVIGVVQGTPAASPTVPSLAAFPGAISLAQILIPAGVTATNSGTTITQTAPFTSVADGVVVARTTTERDAYTPASTDLKAQSFVIADGITYKWNGTIWKAWESDWITYTPTIANFTAGSSTIAGRYHFEAGDAVCEIDVSQGAGSAMGTAPTFTTPVAISSTYLSDSPAGDGVGVVAGSTYFFTVMRSAASTSLVIAYARNVAATYESVTNISAAVPAAWGTTGVLQLRFRFRPA